MDLTVKAVSRFLPPCSLPSIYRSQQEFRASLPPWRRLWQKLNWQPTIDTSVQQSELEQTMLQMSKEDEKMKKEDDRLRKLDERFDELSSKLSAILSSSGTS